MTFRALGAWPAPPCLALLSALLACPAAANERQDVGRSSVEYVADVFVNTAGGKRQGTALLGKLEARVMSPETLFGLNGAHASAAVQYTHGRLLSDSLVGDAQTISNIEAVSALRLYEAWVALPVAARTSIKLGVIDLNTEFDVQEFGLHFINSSHGIGPEFSQSGLNGPSIFPTTATGMVLRHATSANVTFRVGLFDGVAGDPANPRRTVIRFPSIRGALSTAELDLPVGSGSRLRVGGWRYTRKIDEIGAFDSGGPAPRHRSAGAYAMIEGPLAGRDTDKPVNGWLRLGVADARVSPISTSIVGGVTFGDEGRKWGIAFAHARLGKRSRLGDTVTAKLDRAETNVELSYAHAINDRLTLQPDVQFVRNPGWEPGRRDALVLGLRITAGLL